MCCGEGLACWIWQGREIGRTLCGKDTGSEEGDVELLGHDEGMRMLNFVKRIGMLDSTPYISSANLPSSLYGFQPISISQRRAQDDVSPNADESQNSTPVL